MNLSDEELQLLKKYQKLSTSSLSQINRVAVEIIPPVIFVGIGLYLDKIEWFLALITLMVAYNVKRVIRQQKYIALLRSIAEKVQENK